MNTKPGMFPSVKSVVLSLAGWTIAGVIAVWMIYEIMTWLIHLLIKTINPL